MLGAVDPVFHPSLCVVPRRINGIIGFGAQFPAAPAHFLKQAACRKAYFCAFLKDQISQRRQGVVKRLVHFENLEKRQVVWQDSFERSEKALKWN